MYSEGFGSVQVDYFLLDFIEVILQFVLLEWKVEDFVSFIFFGIKREVLRVDMVFGVYIFQEINFNLLVEMGSFDYGMLYFGIGDGSLVLKGYFYLCDNNEYIWGVVIWIDFLGMNGQNGQYGILKDNFFVDELKVLLEVWVYGFCNLYCISWDEIGFGKMFIINIGQYSVEEVNLG